MRKKSPTLYRTNNNNKTFFFVAAIGRRFLSYLFRYECVTNLFFFITFLTCFYTAFLRAEDRMKCGAHQQRPVTSSRGCCSRRGVYIDIWQFCIAGLSKSPPDRSRFLHSGKGNAVNCRSPTRLVYSEKKREKIFPRSILITQLVFFVLHVANAYMCVCSFFR